jgi:hypothetical protein
MSEDIHISKRTVVYTLPGVEAVKIRRDAPYRGSLTMDLYYPDALQGAAPATVIVAGFPDPGFERSVGCKFKEMGSSVSWAGLMAASGMVAIAYTNREPAADLHALLQHVRENGAALGIDAERIGLWASSGNAPLALSALMTERIACAALCYPYTLDVVEIANKFGFANPADGKSVDDLPRDVPLFIARAGNDEMPGLNQRLDRFVSEAIARNLPVTVVNHPTAAHAFDLIDDSDATREIIRQILAFARFHLLRAAP